MNTYQEVWDALSHQIDQCRTVLVGIGEEWGTGSEQERRDAYEALAAALKWCNYFIVTMNTDDLIFESGLDANHIVAPFGSDHRYQCENGCEQQIWAQDQWKDGMSCPHCGGMLVPNRKDCENYVEAGYLPQWQKYTDWLTHTLNHDMTILECGVGFDMPGVIRWPFERIAFLNRKAQMLRIHESWHQLSEELAQTGRCRGFACQSRDLFVKQKREEV